MTDRELLEDAAKAAGIANYTMRGDSVFVETGAARGDAGYYWNPLTDDGDALRLAVSLRLHVSVFADAIGIGTPGWDYVEYKWQGDPCSATRRAIVRAAAELGRSMK